MGTPQLLDIPLTPWEHVSVDGCRPFPLTARGHDYSMNFICTNLPCLKTITAKETAKLYFKHVFPRTGMSQVIHSDRVPQFIAQFWKCLWKILQTKVALSEQHHPKSNQYIERQNKNFHKAWSRVEQGGDLDLLSTEHNNLQHPSQKLAPKWLGPLKVLEISKPNAVQVEIPPCFTQITQLQNVVNRKPPHQSWWMVRKSLR
jgi:hypothetical protein